MTGDLFPPALREKLRPAGAPVPHPGDFATAPLPAALDEAIATFTEACEAVGGRVSRVSEPAAVVDLVLSYLASPEWTTGSLESLAPFTAWDPGHLPMPDVVQQLEARGAARLEGRVGREQATRHADYQRLDRAIVGLTGAHAALVDTGSVVLVHGDGRPRVVSLLPPVHVALVPVERLHATLGALWRAQPDLLRTSANVVLVTGPSRTADIEMTLTRGVHGPRIVHVVFVG